MGDSVFKAMFEFSPAAQILVNAEQNICLVNREAERLFGYDKGELIGKKLEVLIPLPARKIGKGRDLFGLRKDGCEFPIEVGLNPMKTDEGSFVMSSIVDITSRIKAEEKFRAVFEAAPNAMIVVDEKGLVVMVNGQTEQVFGYPRDELLGQPIEILIPVNIRGRHPELVKSYTENASPRPMGKGRDLFAVRKNGTQFPVEIGLRPFRGTEGLFVISSIVDISERVKSRKKLEDRNEELEQFAYRTSHDLRAPLSTITGILDFVNLDINAGKSQEAIQSLEKASTLARKLDSLVEEILLLTKSDYINEEMKEVDLAEVFESAKLKFEYLAAEKDTRLICEFSHARACRSQKIRVTQIVDNLISNAIKYSDSAKENRFVLLKTFDDQRGFHILVQDNGLGFPPQRIPEVFGMFKRFHTESATGTGLGLYLVKKHIQKLNGEIFVDTKEGVGTSFHLVLPF